MVGDGVVSCVATRPSNKVGTHPRSLHCPAIMNCTVSSVREA